ncbi:MAG TPA: hypothetical protein VKF42_12055 [Chitinivibrionales bacterium]|jgi:hypothetical protein|nr:hypothetical protein [Chitinivibrionales bacterium]
MEQHNPSNVQVLVAPESLLSILGVVYVHKKTSDNGDMYFTRHGLPLASLLAIENWYEKEWFEEHREHLQGTGAVYRVPTKAVDGASIELVVKNCRVGEDVPLDTHMLMEFINAEFNSPWEEFSLVMELGEGKYGPQDVAINTQEPLAIYVPPEKMQLWQSGRSRSKINKIKARHPGVDLDILRQYKLVYGWIQGVNVVEAFTGLGLKDEELITALEPITRKAIGDLDKKGYVVADMKPEHVIIGDEYTRALAQIAASGGEAARTKQVEFVYGLVEAGRYSVVDYELLLRTPPHDEEVKYSRRHSYLDDQRDRFIPAPLPPYLQSTEVFGVPYIHGHVESTGGQLWVVGRNARLFDYFLPERWRKTVSFRLSEDNEVFYTVTKDNVHIVWKTSRVGETPAGGPSEEHNRKAAEFGFNSPFEEFAIAQFLLEHGVGTVYVRAIYMTGSDKMEQSTDPRRYESHKSLVGPDGSPILLENRNYLSIRGYYNGPDSWVAQQKGLLCRPMDLVSARTNNRISHTEYKEIFGSVQRRLLGLGYDGSLLEGNDILLALDPAGVIMRDESGGFDARICNFELIRKL